MVTKYLRQKGSGHIYISTPLIAGRKDMVEYDPDVAAIRIKQLKNKMAKKAEENEAIRAAGDEKALEMREQAKELTDLEEAQKQIEQDELDALAEEQGDVKPDGPKKTDEEIESIVKNETIGKDPEIIKIRGFTTKNEVEAYVLEQWGQEIDRTLELSDLKQVAELMRVERIFED